MSNPRPTSDGRLQYPKRGLPPVLRDGYIRDPGDPYTLCPQYPPCTQREQIINDKIPCNRSPTGFRTEIYYVCHKGLKVSHTSCRDCKERTPPKNQAST